MGRLTKYMPRDAHRLLLARIAAARAKDAEDRQQEQQAHAAELAALHDIIAAYEAVTDPEQHPDLFARSSAVLEDCRNPACADQAVVQDLRDQLAAKDAEIADLTRKLHWFTAYTPCHWIRTEIEYITDCGQVAFPVSKVPDGTCNGCGRKIVMSVQA